MSKKLTRKKKTSKAKEVPSLGATAADKQPATNFLIVGIGGSAGSFETIQKFLSEMPAKSGMAFIFVPHLDPTHESLMPELLDKLTEMPVQQVKDETKIEQNNFYIIPPNKTLTVEGGVLRLQLPIETRGLRLPIDAFFRSLAEDQNENAVAVILSGLGSDGTIGIKAIKTNGGVVFSQDMESAKYDSMPRSAILMGLVDYVLPIEDLPEKLIEFAKHRNILHVEKGVDGIRTEMQSYLGEICSILQRRTGHEFNNYRQNTLMRRIQRRIQVVQAHSVKEYVGLLRVDENNEAISLFKDLLIGVTHFFRDTAAFEVLREKVIPGLVAKNIQGQTIRVWVPGCATGEEAYSIAMLLTDEIQKQSKTTQVQIFATDIDEDSLSTARNGIYPETFVEQIPPEFLGQFFEKSNGNYRIVKSLREVCLFSVHNLIIHPPFSRLNLISCRNLLIYLDRDIQNKIMPIFHYSLEKKGFLFLGSSESISGFTNLFRTIDKKNRVFEAKESVVDVRVNFPLVGSRFSRNLRLSMHSPKTNETHQSEIGKVIENILLENYSPSCVIVNERGDVVYFSGRTGKYLEPVQGTPNTNIVNMARRGLRLDLRTALHKAVAAKNLIIQENITVETEDSIQKLNLIIRPLNELGDDSDLYIVVFQDVGNPISLKDLGKKDVLPSVEDQNVRELEKELRMTKEHLQTTIEEQETTNEELKSSNEELLSMNEELQSSNEELQTSKEELQSINEEFETVNTELFNKIEELDAANSDLQNLLQSTDVATIFLDSDLRIKNFTPVTNGIFNLIRTDIGRPITDIVPRLSSFNVAKHAKFVINTLKSVQQEVKLTGSNEHFVMRMIPYRTIDNVVDGVVITFVEVTEIRKSKENAEKRAKEKSAIAELGLFAVQNSKLQPIFDKATKIVCDNLGVKYSKVLKLLPDTEELFLISGRGWKKGLVGKATVETDVGSQAGFTLSRSSPIIVKNLIKETRFSGPDLLLEHKVKSGISVIIHGIENPWGVFGIHTPEEIEFTQEEVDFLQSIANIVAAAIQRNQNTQALKDSEQRLSLALETGDMASWEWDLVKDKVIWSSKLYSLLGMKESKKLPTSEMFFDRIHPEDIEKIRKQLAKNLEKEGTFQNEFRVIKKDDKSVRWLTSQAKIISYNNKKPEKMVGIIYDITEYKENHKKLENFNRELEQNMSALRDSELRLSLALEAGKMGTWEWDIESSKVIWTKEINKLIGVNGDIELITYKDFLERVHPDDIDDLRILLEGSIAQKKDYYNEFRIIRKDTEEVRWLVGQAQIMFPPNKPKGVMIGINYDITDYKNAQTKLQEFNEKLEQRVKERTSKLNQLNKTLKKETEDRVKLLRQLVTIQEDERSRIARDIHDQLGQQLTALRLKLESLKSSNEHDEELLKKLDDTQSIAEELDSDVSFLAWRMRPSALDDIGLVAALENYTKEWSNQFDIKADFHSSNLEKERLSPEVETQLYRIAQESLNNVSKHAKATKVDVLLENRNGKILLIVEDDGRGFDLKKRKNKKGMGIDGMRERSKLIGGSFTIESKLNKGTTVYVRIPDNIFENE